MPPSVLSAARFEVAEAFTIDQLELPSWICPDVCVRSEGIESFWDSDDGRLLRRGARLIQVENHWWFNDGRRVQHVVSGAATVPPGVADRASRIAGTAPLSVVAKRHFLDDVTGLRDRGGRLMVELHDERTSGTSPRVVSVLAMTGEADHAVRAASMALRQTPGVVQLRDDAPIGVNSLAGPPPSLVATKVWALAGAMFSSIDSLSDRHTNADAVHDARVAARRLHSVVVVLAPILAKHWYHDVAGRVQTMAKALGDARDAEVIAEQLNRHARRFDDDDRAIIEALAAQELMAVPAAGALVVTAMGPHELVLLVDRLNDIDGALRPDADPRRCVRKCLLDVDRRLEKLDRDKPRSVHRARVHVKQARYATEAFGGKKPIVALLTALQELLGAVTDAEMLSQWARLRAQAPITSRQAYVLGVIVERERVRAELVLAKVTRRTRLLHRLATKS